MRNAYTEPVCLEHLRASNRIVYVIKRLKPLFLDPYFQFCKYSHARLSILAFVIVIFVGPSPRTFTVRSVCKVESLCF